jgi:DNA repair protein RecO (recombination protein O)
MALIETESIVLRTYDLAEADKIVVLLTRDHGVIRGVAKGAKRLKSKFGSGLELFSVIRLTYFQKESVELVAIEKAELIRSYFASASDPDFLKKFAYLGELLITFSPPHDPNETIYRMAAACLEATAEDPGNLLSAGVYFELWLLRLAGYLPDWSRCNNCKRELDPTEGTDLGPNFYLNCRRCSRSAGNRSIAGEHRRLFASALRLSPLDFARSSAGQARWLDELSLILKRIISQSIGREVVNEASFGIRI